MKRLLLLLIVPGLVLMSESASAQGRGGPKPKEAKKAGKAPNAKGNKPDGGHREPAAVIVIDRDGHHRVVRDYYTRQALPPGLAKRRELPPGLRRQLHERGALPPGLDKHWVAVPAPLIRVLPPVPPNYRRYFVGNDLIVIDPGLHIIVQIIPDALPPIRR